MLLPRHIDLANFRVRAECFTKQISHPCGVGGVVLPCVCTSITSTCGRKTGASGVVRCPLVNLRVLPHQTLPRDITWGCHVSPKSISHARGPRGVTYDHADLQPNLGLVIPPTKRGVLPSAWMRGWRHDMQRGGGCVGMWAAMVFCNIKGDSPHVDSNNTPSSHQGRLVTHKSISHGG